MSLPDTAALRRRCDLARGLGIACEPDQTGRAAIGRVGAARLRGSLAPVLALGDGAVAGAQARLVADPADGRHPRELFEHATSAPELLRLDRLARTLHAIDFAARARPGQSLHVVVHPRVIEAVPANHGEAFRAILDAIGLGDLPVVVELPELAPGEEIHVAPVARSYRAHRFRVAFRPSGRRQFDALLATVGIDVLCIGVDRLVRFGALDAAFRQARRQGIELVVDGAASAFDVELAREAGASCVAGPVFGGPTPVPDLSTPLADRAEAALPDAQRLDVRRYLGMAWSA